MINDDIPMKERNLTIEAFRLGLAMIGFGLNYKDAALLYAYVNEYNKKKGSFNISDGIDIRAGWAVEMDNLEKGKLVKIKEDENNNQ